MAQAVVRERRVLQPQTRLPTEDELPDEDDSFVENQESDYAAILLTETLDIEWQSIPDRATGRNMVYHHTPPKPGRRIGQNELLGPDMWAAVGVPKRLRRSWVRWVEGKAPDVVVEFLSGKTAHRDRTTKKRLYEQTGVQDYFWYHPHTSEFKGFHLVQQQYVELTPDASGALYCQALDLYLLRWQGEYKEQSREWLRWRRPDGTLLPTAAEATAQAMRKSAEALAEVDRLRQHAAQAREITDRALQAAAEASEEVDRLRRHAQEAEEARAAAERRIAAMAARLRALGLSDE